MRDMKYLDKTEGVYAITNVDSNIKPFVLWREVLMAYVAPAIMAGIGGLITADKGLQIGALTTIGGTSAIVAWMFGLWLRSRGIHNRWIIGANHLVVVGIFTLIGTMFGLFAAWSASCLLGPFNHFIWFDRVWIDFPLSAMIASTIITWRWRLNVKKIFVFKGEDRK